MIKLDDALSSVTALCFDTAPLIYFIEQHPHYLNIVREIFRRVNSMTIAGLSSVITLTEVLTKPKRLQNAMVESESHNLLLYSRNFNLIPIDYSIAESAASLRARYRLRTPDALQLAAALNSGCEAFLTNDSALQRVTELRVLVLDQLEL
jgi:predicted nucleic acid-binding protein